jgi:uncharacterized membrane protein YkvA (DUF1232 family)
MAGWIGSVKQSARAIKRDVMALWIAARDPKTPMAAKLVAGAVAAYALSPIDLIPDFIPVLGYLDDLLIVPLGILLAIRMIPPDLMTDFRQRAALQQNRPSSRAGLVAIVLIWLALSALAGWAAYRYVYPA